MKNVAVIILAAGKGERMKSDTPKVLHPLCGRPMLNYVIDLIRSLRINPAITVLGYKHQQVRAFLPKEARFVIQQKISGTGDAVKTALIPLKNFKGTVLILYADIPLLTQETIKKLIRYHIENKADVTLLSAKIDKPLGYGRILRDEYDSICGIVEEKDADDFQKEIKEINTGIICFNKTKLDQALKKIRPNNRKKEYYLTDAISIIYKNGGLVENVQIVDHQEAMGINSRLDLALANKLMQKRINEKIMKNGVTLVDPDTAFISYDCLIGEDTVIYPFTVIEKNVKIGKHCSVGPFIRLRAGTVLEDSVTAGNFLEISRSRLSFKTLIKHFGYIGDARIGRFVNIGAGSVTANYDGVNKNKTIIKDRAFIGSDTIMVAPVKIGKKAMTAA
ncbi:MAG: NTP transferase domain-containing protein, partial [Candidatus Omnitrophica bacterium]|nr:NTP transferase domain-containing protein [Candidatus Omnitrophota bacterium]